MPKSNYSRKSARIFPASDLSDKCLKRRLERLRRKHHGACARLASQSQAFATDDPRQDRFFCSALLESLANHLLYNKSLYADAARLMPVLPNPHAQWDKLEEQLVRWQGLTFSPSALSTPSTTKLWPLTHSKVEAAQASPNAKLAQPSVNQLSYDGKSLSWGRQMLQHQAAQLGFCSHEKIDYVICFDPASYDNQDYWASQMAQATCLLTKTNSKTWIDLCCADKTVLREHLNKLQAELGRLSSCSRTVRLIIRFQSMADFIDSCVHAQAASISLPSKSRVIVILDTCPDDAESLNRSIKFLSGYFCLPLSHINCLWCQSHPSLVLWSCQKGNFHWPIYYKLAQERYFCNPCARNYPLLAVKVPWFLSKKFSCSCGLRAPVVELEVRKE